ncbi:hypothetical protein SCHPADRAFT_894616 [Schizopora paradoxa]|uniref:AMP-activated protein kinase glycogen-binding domain-containing protein n=1 Tax=Schizopora paradoxa TaxID=27342 RepID=A0A0H2R6M3_9AGAM|nr:hypothetical protein SCHPADRAFT_894616 [Schizopora paradoxa]
MADSYDLTFVWPHTEPNDVVVTGTFDDWSSSLHLARTDSGFEGKVSVPWGSKVVYKFRLDGDWIVLEDQPTEIDPIGNVNNMTYAPEKPVTAHAIKAARSGSTIIVDKDKAVPAYTVPTPASIAASLSQNGDAGAGTVISEPEPMFLDPVLEDPEKHSPEEPATVAPDVPLVIEPVVDKSLDTTASPDVQSKAAEGAISTHTPAVEGTVDSAAEPEPKPEVKEEVTTPLPEPKELATNAAAAASVPLPETPAAVPTDAPAVPPKPSTPPPVPADSEKPAESAPPTPAKTNGTITPAPSAPTTPKKTAFPSHGEDEGGSSPSSVRSRLGSVRKKRLSIIDKIKSVFHHDHHEHHDNENGEEHKEADKEKEKDKKKEGRGTIRRTSLFKSHSASNNGNDAK